MTCQVDSPALIWLLQQLASMQGNLRDKSIVIFLRETSRIVKGTGDDADSLELRSGIANSILIDSKSLCKELIANLFEAGLISNFTTHYKKTQGQIGASRAIDSLIKIADTLVHESV
jgi:hypothetical protein